MADSSERTHYCSLCLTTFTGELEACPNLSCRNPCPEDGWGSLLDAGDVIDRHYQVIRRLAIGGAGVTYLARELDDSGRQVGPKLAIKVLYAQRDQGAYLRRLSTEAQILQELDHPGIVRMMGFVTRAGHSPYLVTRFEEGGSLLDHLRREGAMPAAAVAALGLQLCDALAVAHERGVVHRDLKPENILLEAIPASGEVPHVRITDFGVAKVKGGLQTRLTRVGSFVGTPQYASPEQFEGSPPTPAADVYALGAVLLFCVTLRPLVPMADRLDPADTADLLRSKLPPRLEPGDFTDPLEPAKVAGFNTVLAATMAFEPTERAPLPRVRDLLAAFQAGDPSVVSADTAVPVSSDPPPPEGDTFAGILSEPRPGGAARPPAEPTVIPPPPDPAELGPGVPVVDQSGGCMKWVLLGFALVLLGGLALAGSWVLAPALWPPPARFAAVARARRLDPRRPADRRIRRAIERGVSEHAAALGRCRPPVDRPLVLRLLVLADGSVAAVDHGRMGLLPAICIRRELLGATIDRPGSEDVIADVRMTW